MKASVAVSAVQLAVSPLMPEVNRARMVDFISAESAIGADLVLFPELANAGYVRDRDPQFGAAYLRCAEQLDGPTIEALAAAARLHRVHVLVGLLERYPLLPGTMSDTAVLIDCHGNVAGVQRKLHLPATEKHYFFPANELAVHSTELGTIGLVVCYDFLFPEVVRTLALHGAEIVAAIFNMPHGPLLEPGRLAAWTMTRARENVLYAIACNRTGPDDSLIFDGGSAIADPTGRCLARGGESEEVLRATLEEQHLLTARVYHSTFRDRRPELYGSIAQNL